MRDDWRLKGDLAAERIDATILALIDMAPERLSWDVLALCETLIDGHIETSEHLNAMLTLLDMLPQCLHQEGRAHTQSLMAASGREVISVNPPICVDQQSAKRWGWIVA